MAMAAATESLRPLHPLHALLLSFPLPLFLGALLSDLAYFRSYHVQWINFSAWLIAGALFVGAFVVLWALVGLFRGTARRGLRTLYAMLLVAMWALGFINALVHAKDAWSTMPAGLYLSLIVALLALAASWIGYSGFRAGDVR